MRQNAEVRVARDSGIELLRFIAMFLVLVVHADFMALGEPSAREMRTDPLASGMRILFESFSIVCVNTFVLISGWFGIHPRVKGCGKLLFQTYFFLVVCYFAACVWDAGGISVARYFLLQDDYWFVKAYLGLMIMAPVMNVFIERTSRRPLFGVLLGFYVFQTILGWVSDSVGFLMGGYSTISFMGLYMLARYVRLYSPRLRHLSFLQCVGLYFAVCVVMAGLSAVVLYFGGISISGKLVMSYVNPFTIMASLFLVLGFSRLGFRSRAVNWLAVSCLAVYLLHCNSLLWGAYLDFMRGVYDRYDGFACIMMMFLALLLVFCCAIIIDQVRILCWKGLERAWHKIGSGLKSGVR